MSKGTVTIKDVAQRAGVSVATVSYVFNNTATISPATRERVLQAAAELNYKPSALARQLRIGQSRTIGYCWHTMPKERWQPILDRFLYGMAEAAEAAGYHILTFTASDVRDLEAYEQLLLSGRVDGFVLSDTNYNDPRIACLMEHEFPFVAFGRANPDWDFPYVDVDNEEGEYQATRHLIERGHRRIALLAWPEDSLSGNYRERGYRRALQEAGLPFNPALIQRSAPGLNAEQNVAFGRAATLALLALPQDERPTALVALNDMIAMGAYHGLYDAGLEPGRDVAVVGYDDIPLIEHLRPPLSSVRQPISEAGQKVVSMLLKILRNEPLEERHILLKPELIIRESSMAYWS